MPDNNHFSAHKKCNWKIHEKPYNGICVGGKKI